MDNTPLRPQDQLNFNSLGGQSAYGTPPLHAPLSSTTGPGTAQPCTLNLVVRPEQLENGSQGSETQSRIERVERRLERVEHRLERLESVLGDLQASLTNMRDTMELQRISHEEKVSHSIEIIKRGMDKFFTRFANELKPEMMATEELSERKADLAIM
ncbi:hypothetical protein NW759_016379 [Fusarium solani]|nr:hypothetical protein NW759_016379 [Fusarium solani]